MRSHSCAERILDRFIDESADIGTRIAGAACSAVVEGLGIDCPTTDLRAERIFGKISARDVVLDTSYRRLRPTGHHVVNRWMCTYRVDVSRSCTRMTRSTDFPLEFR